MLGGLDCQKRHFFQERLDGVLVFLDTLEQKVKFYNLTGLREGTQYPGADGHVLVGLENFEPLVDFRHSGPGQKIVGYFHVVEGLPFFRNGRIEDVLRIHVKAGASSEGFRDGTHVVGNDDRVQTEHFRVALRGARKVLARRMHLGEANSDVPDRLDGHHAHSAEHRHPVDRLAAKQTPDPFLGSKFCHFVLLSLRCARCK